MNFKDADHESLDEARLKLQSRWKWNSETELVLELPFGFETDGVLLAEAYQVNGFSLPIFTCAEVWCVRGLTVRAIWQQSPSMSLRWKNDFAQSSGQTDDFPVARVITDCLFPLSSCFWFQTAGELDFEFQAQFGMEWGKCQKLPVCKSCSQLGWRVLVFRLSSERLDLLWGLTASHGSARRISSEINLIIWEESLLFSKHRFEITVTHGFEMQLQALVLAFYSMAFFQLGEIAFLFNLFFYSLLGSKSPYLVSKWE